MSKAFTSEETPELGPVVRPPPRLAPGEVRWVTPEGHAALRAELERLRAARAEAGALPESTRPARLAELDARLATIEATIAALTPRGPAEAPPGEAGFACWVTVEDEAGERKTWRLVGPDETDARRGLVSVHAPLGRALLGRRPGEVALVRRPGGEAELTVLAVSHAAPLAAGARRTARLDGAPRRGQETAMRILHTMIRVGDLERSLGFYTGVLGMKLLRKHDYPDGRFTLAFVGYGEEADTAVLELTHNWDTKGYELGGGFGHVALEVDDAYAACADIAARGGKVVRPAGPMKHGTTVIAFVEDPDGYKIELIQRKVRTEARD